MIGKLMLMAAALLLAPANAPVPPGGGQVADVLAANGFEGFAMVASADAVLWQTPRSACRRSKPATLSFVTRAPPINCAGRGPR
ncbi:hypothetical protein [Sphingomonas sp.]|uniref:hypothetical protein n=1 Tax=Sphingomonas sp. TaxID=28214 RepID=UPI002ED8CA3B